ncbi:MAG: fumarylacetoacetate hydrolase family protein [Gammaproteobacteria bacterium]|nr:fumarylacetoacetate hydrolase family protein [Gammaproteobacteria bacterium]
MFLVSFVESNQNRLGVLDRQRSEVIDLARADPGLPHDMLAFIALGEAGLAQARRALTSVTARISLAQVRLVAPIPRPVRNIFCVGKNYREHVQELQTAGAAFAAKDSIPEVPIFFTKATSSVIGPRQAIPARLDPTHSVDYEGELAVVIGRGGRGIARADALRHVYGYTIINDVSSRVLQRQHQQWFLGKSLDGFCPMGPAIATVDEIPDVTKLQIHTRVNGELRQNAAVSSMIFDIPTLIETLSRAMTLEPGDIISTGTPAGVGMGFQPPKYLQQGDVVTITIEPLGTLENPVA